MKTLLLTIACATMMLASWSASAQPTPDPTTRTERFSWTMPSTSSAFTGFKIHFGTVPCPQPCTGNGTYSVRTDLFMASKNPANEYFADVQIQPSLASQTLYFSVTAYNGATPVGESDYSNERSRTAAVGRPSKPTLVD